MMRRNRNRTRIGRAGGRGRGGDNKERRAFPNNIKHYVQIPRFSPKTQP